MKHFDIFVAKNFNGYSAHTLYQLLNFPNAINWIYVSIFHVFSGKESAADRKIYNHVRNIAYGDLNFTQEEQLAKELIEEHEYCLSYGYKDPNFDYIKNHALDWYIKGFITLDQFKYVRG